MTSIFTKYTELDPVLFERQVEARKGSAVFDKYSVLDEQRMLRQAATALGGTLTNAALLDPRRAAYELDVLAAGGGGGGNTYVAKAVEFAASSGLVCASSSLADTSVLSGRLLINWSADAYNDDDAILNITRTDLGGAANFLMDQFIGNSDPSTVGIQMTGTDSGNVFYVGSPTGSIVNDVWYEYFFSMDIAHEAGSRLATSYLGDTDIKQIVIDTGSSFVLPLNGYKIRFPDGFFPGPVRLADCWVTTTHYVDWSDPTNRAKFHDGSGKPIDLGADGSTPFGYQPEIFRSGDDTGFQTNKGSAGDVFTLTGTITNATTSPSD